MRNSALLLLPLPLLLAGAAGTQERVDYTRQVKPLLANRCGACHGALKQEGGLRLDTGWLARKGGDSGKAVIPGKVAESLLIQRITDADPSTRMPPEGEIIKPEEVALLKAWVAQGARSPLSEAPDTDPKKHWAFLKPEPRPVPAFPAGSAAAKWVRNPIDAFVAAEQGKRGVQPNPEAPREVLLRRVYLDLIGLPPTREQLHAFLADRSPDAYERVVDQLLASPQYGERWGRHWMDVWRYSDWYGRRSINDVRNSYGQMWRWRDWIVRSLNEDKGYDRMVTEMLAADEVAPGDLQALPATGFLVRNWYSLNYNQWMRDNVEHTGKAFLGLTLNCAHCHDHKYDPISQKDYFRFRAFFEPLELRHERVPGEPDPGLFPKYVYGGSTPVLKTGMIRVFDEKLDAKTVMYERGDERNVMAGVPPVEPGVPQLLSPPGFQVQPVALPAEAAYPGLKPFVREEELARREKAIAEAKAPAPGVDPRLTQSKIAVAEADLAALKARIAADDARYRSAASANAEALAREASRSEAALALRNAEAKLLRAELEVAAAGQKGDMPALQKAQSQVVAVQKELAGARKALETPTTKYTPLSPLYPEKSTGRRAALARWIVSKDNPLTARVAVNHVWRYHFGKPLVDSVFDFGRNGKKPRLPELLDYLATVFSSTATVPTTQRSRAAEEPGRGKPLVAVAGSANNLIKVSGAAGSQFAPRTAKYAPPATRPPGARPTQGLGWSFKALHRLIVTSSTYRMASSPAAGGPRNLAKDPENRSLWRYEPRRAEAEVIRDSILAAGGGLDATLGGPEIDNGQEASRRRSLYYGIFAEDGGQMRMLATFDAPDPCDSYRRTESIMPQQALALTNGRLALEQGRQMARQLWAELPKGADDRARSRAFITAAFERALSRRPTRAEMEACLAFMQEQSTLFRSASPVAGTATSLAVPASDPALRAGESLCLALFSHTDFVTLR